MTTDRLAPAMTFMFPSLYAAARPCADVHRFNQVRARATVACLAVNVITI